MTLDKVSLRNAIKQLAGKEGSHIINHQNLKAMSFALSPSKEEKDLENADFGLPWKCLVAELAIRLLCAVRANKRTLVRQHTLPAIQLRNENNLYVLE